ncbi:MAG: adenylate kinase [bacterium]|nr:adenylate kinase [Muribaculaceae bacterium]MDD6832020.1 adenylate kinase [bacterium]MDD6900471.1 adenylate kinase [bacterium]MDY4184776.1 adenylate kinase [Sodaliphilus sp.]
MLNIVMFGAPGSGKGTQSEVLIKTYGLFHISTGDVLRDHIKRGTALGKTAQEYINQGQLIPDELMVNILASVMDDNKDAAAKGVIFDGFPRTIPQAEALEEMLQQRGTKVSAVIGLDVPEEILIGRLLNRGKESGRSDDNLETITSRLEVYNNQTAPLKAFYAQKGLLHMVQGTGGAEVVFERVRKVIEAVQ